MYNSTLHESLRSVRSSVHRLRKSSARSAVKTRAVVSEVREATSQETTSPSAEHAQAGTGAPSTPTPSVPAETASTEQQDTAQPSAPEQQQSSPSSAYGTNRSSPSWSVSSSSDRDKRDTRIPYKGNRQWDATKGNTRQGGRGPQGPTPFRVPREELAWLQPNQPVLCKVVYSNPSGFKVAMVKDERIGGYAQVYLMHLVNLTCLPASGLSAICSDSNALHKCLPTDMLR